MKNQINKVNVEKASSNVKANSLIALDVLKSVKEKNAGRIAATLVEGKIGFIYSSDNGRCRCNLCRQRPVIKSGTKRTITSTEIQRPQTDHPRQKSIQYLLSGTVQQIPIRIAPCFFYIHFVNLIFHN